MKYTSNNLKKYLCNYLIKNKMVKEYDVIKHSYTNARFNDWSHRNVECNNISPTLDTRCDCLGVVVNDMSIECIGGIGEKSQIMELNGINKIGYMMEMNLYRLQPLVIHIM